MLENIVWHKTKVEKKDRENLFKQKGIVLWFTGLSGSGKSTLAVEIEKKLYEIKKHTYILDGDNIRHGLNNDLDFSENSRKENIRRIGEVAKLFVDAGIITLVSFISPFIQDRENVRKKFQDNEFIEIYVKCSSKECEKRDVKGLYKKAREGKIENFTGIDSPYEEPLNPEIIVDTENNTIEECALKIIEYIIRM